MNYFKELTKDFCLDEFWNPNIFWHSQKPALTKCFENVGLTIIPNLIFASIIFIFEFNYIFNSKNNRISFNKYNFFRQLLCSISILINLITLYNYLFFKLDNDLYSLSDLLATLSRILLFILFSITYNLSRLNGLITSGNMFTINLLITISSGLILFDSLLYNESMYSNLEIINYQLTFFCSFCLFCLCFTTDDSVEAGLKISEKIKKLNNEKEINKFKSRSPRLYSSFLKKITNYWFIDFFRISKKNCNTINLWDLEDDMKIELIKNKFNKEFFKEKFRIYEHNKFSDKKLIFNELNLLKVIWKVLKDSLLISILLKFISDLFLFAFPVLIGLMINFISNSEEVIWHGYVYCLLFLFLSILTYFASTFHTMFIYKFAFNLRSCLLNLIYSKSLKLQSKKNNSTGELITLSNVDCNKFVDAAPYSAFIFSSPFQIIIGLYLLYKQIGNAVFIGLFMIIIMVIIQFLLGKYANLFLKGEMKLKSSRIKLVSEILNGIRIIKFYGYEKPFIDKINDKRLEEIEFIRKSFIIDLINWFLFLLSPSLVLISSFSIYLFFIDGKSFNSEKVFVSISIFNAIQYPIEVLPTCISYLRQCRISLKRITIFLNQQEHERYINRIDDNKFALTIKNKAKFTWDIETLLSFNKPVNDCFAEKYKLCNKIPFQLKNIELEIKKNSFTAIIGQIGSGKSSLISAILGDMYLIENDFGMKGKVNISHELNLCYTPQEAWILNTSFKNNILFGKPFYQQQYDDVISACALETDLKQFEAGDETEIGEKGINLSGGQKQRINIARACYQSVSTGNKNQIILLDDPLSAVDVHVGRHLCENVLSSKTGLLKNTTRILVTNQLNQLNNLDVDKIILLKDGEIKLNCSLEELIKMYKNGELDEYNLKFNQIEKTNKIVENVSNIEKLDEKSNLINKTNENNKNLIKEEALKEGNVDFNYYKTYFDHFGYSNILLILVSVIMENSFQIFSRLYLADWTKNKNFNDTTLIKDYNKEHLITFGCLAFSQCIFNLFFNFFFILGIVSTIRLFFENLLYSILRSPMNFFEQTPIGRIANRLSKDIDLIDRSLPISIREFLLNFLRIMASVTIILIKQKELFIPYSIIMLIVFFIVKYYLNITRKLKRFDSSTKSLIITHIEQSFSGVTSIRAYNRVGYFEKEFRNHIDLNLRTSWYSICGNCWLNFNLSALTSLMILIVTIKSVLQKGTSFHESDAGLLITYAMTIRQSVQYVVRLFTTVELNAVSIERVMEYSNNIPEDDFIKQDNRPPENWPSKGEIEFIDYSTKYREGTKLVLKDLNFKIDGNNKVGVIGRTGAGKSTITLALFRIIEPFKGKIVIDNIDITKIGLYDLRSKLSIIPQDPVLFTGTIRFNLDPFNQYSDSEIYQSLEHSHLKEYINMLEDGIYSKISEGGQNLSVGQRQLICLARALLRKSKILVLDEATASVDFATDELVQKTIRSEFKNCTTITIAHRLNTILDSSKILVLDKGELKEYDRPDKLLKNTDSLFYEMAFHANLIE